MEKNEVKRNKASAAKLRSIAKWEAANYDKVLIRFPKGTKDRINATGETVNGIVKRLVLSWLDAQEGKQPPQDTTD